MKCLHQKMATVLFYSKRGAYCSYLSTSIAEIFMLGKVPAVMMLGESKNNLAEVKEMKQQETGNIIVSWEHRDIVGSSTKRPKKELAFSWPWAKRHAELLLLIMSRLEKQKDEKFSWSNRCEGKVIAWQLSWDEIWKWITSGKFPALSHLWSILPTTHLITNDDKSRYEKLVH